MNRSRSLPRLRLPPVLGALLLAGIVAATASPAGSQPTGTSESRERRLVETYRQMLAEDPFQDYALRRLLEVSHAVGGLQGLVDVYRERVAERPEDASAWAVLGHLHEAAGRDEEAIESYGRAADLLPRDPGPHAAEARLHRRARAWDESLAAWSRALERTRDRAARQEMLREAAETALDADRLDRAEGWFRDRIATDPDNLHLRMEYAATLARLGYLERALEAWREVRERADGQRRHLVVVWREMAGLQEQLGRLDASEETLREALREIPGGHWARAGFFEELVGVYRRRDALRELIEELEPRTGRSREVRLLVGRLYEEVGEDRRALELFRRAARQRPGDVDVHLAIIRILERIGETDEIVGAYRALVRAAPGEPRHRLELAAVLLQRGRVEEGFRLLSRLSRRYPSDPGVHQRIIDLTMRYGDASERDRIEREYRILMRLEPDEESHVISLGEYFWTRGDEERAFALWERLPGMGRSPGEGRFVLAEVYADHDLKTRAAEQYEAAIAAEPDNPRYPRAYALWLEEQKQPALALEWWERVAELNRGAEGARARAASAEARRRILTLWERTGRLGGEIEALARRFEAEPPEVEAGHVLARAHLRAGRLDDAERVLERLRRLDPTSLEALLALEEVHTRQSRLGEAIEVLEELARLDGRSAYEYLHRAAELALGLGDEERALAYTRRVVDLNPADPAAHARVGELFQRLGRRTDAAEAWRQALTLDPRNDGLRFRLAALYRDLDDPVREERMLLEIVRESSDPSRILDAGRQLLQVATARGRLRDVERSLRPLVGAPGAGEGVRLRLLVDLYGILASDVRMSGLPAAERRQRARELGERALKPLVDALDGDDVALRARALRVLSWTRPPGAVPALARLASDPNGSTRVQAAVGLGGIGSEAAVKALGRLSDAPDRDVREAAIWALGLTGAPEATKHLTRGVVAGTPRTRQFAALALGRTGGPEALGPLESASRGPHMDLALAALQALGQRAEPDAVEILGAALRSGEETRQRLAAWGLGRVDTDDARRVLVDALWRRDVGPQALIADALLASGPDPDGEARLDAAYVAIAEPEEGRLALDLDALRGMSRPPRPHEVQRLEGLERAAPLLRRRMGELLEAGDRRDRAAFFGSLVDGDGGITFRPLLPVGTKAAEARLWLDELLGDQVAPLLELARHEADVVIRAHALEVVALLSASAEEPVRADVVTAAIEAVGAPEPTLRRAAVRAFGRLGESEGGVALEALLGVIHGPPASRSPGVRVAAAQALSSFDSLAVSEALEALLRDPDARVREAAVRAAAGRGDERLRRALVERLEDPVPAVSRAALDGLHGAREADLRAALERAARSADPVLRVRARAILRGSGSGAP